MSHKQETMTEINSSKCAEAVKMCESWIEADIQTEVTTLSPYDMKDIMQIIKKHSDWNLKWSTGIHFKLEDKDKIKDYSKYLAKKTNELLRKTAISQLERYLYLIFNEKLIKEGGNPLVQEKYGGLRLGFILCKIKNSGLQEQYKKLCPPLYFNLPDYGRNISNMLIRVYRIINNC
tara:strand:- start:11 stop:538 length:528 start_codon:yes stop_codon:yes gene_type:complete